MIKRCNLVVKILIVLLLLVFVVLICKYALSDNQLYKSPYDEDLINHDVVFEGRQDDLELVIYNVEQCVNEWIEEKKLISINIHINNDNNITRCHFTYDIENIDDYLGFCEVTCYYNDEQWVIKNVAKEYLEDDFEKKYTVQIQDVLDKYMDNMKFLNDNDFFRGTDAEIAISNNKVGIIVWGLDEKNQRCIIRRESR